MPVLFRDIIILALMIVRVGTILQLGWYQLNLLCMYLQKLNDCVHRYSRGTFICYLFMHIRCLFIPIVLAISEVSKGCVSTMCYAGESCVLSTRTCQTRGYPGGIYRSSRRELVQTDSDPAGQNNV